MFKTNKPLVLKDVQNKQTIGVEGCSKQTIGVERCSKERNKQTVGVCEGCSKQTNRWY